MPGNRDDDDDYDNDNDNDDDDDEIGGGLDGVAERHGQSRSTSLP